MRSALRKRDRAHALAAILALNLHGCDSARAASPRQATKTAPSGSAAPIASGPTLAQAFGEGCGGANAIPMELAGGREFVNVTVRGPKATETLRFLVDTGGSTRGLFISKAAATRLGASAPEDLPTSVQLGDRKLTLPPGASWTIGDAATDARDLSTRRNFNNGQLGAGFLSRYTVCIDPERRVLGLNAPGSVQVEDPAHRPLPLLMQKLGDNAAKYPFLLAAVDKDGQIVAGYGMLLDTGASGSIIEAGKIHAVGTRDPHTSTAHGAFGNADTIGASIPETMFRIGSIVLTVPSSKFPNPPRIHVGPVTFVSRPDGTFDNMFGEVGPTMGSYGAIANDVLWGYRLLIDYEKEVVWMDPIVTKPDASASATRVGLSLKYGDDGCPAIAAITDTNSKETLDALRVDDVLLSIEGLDACKAMHHEIQAALAGNLGQVIHMSIRRGKQKMDVEPRAATLLPDVP